MYGRHGTYGSTPVEKTLAGSLLRHVPVCLLHPRHQPQARARPQPTHQVSNCLTPPPPTPQSKKIGNNSL
jgi:hypothetical protein